ncbi:MAG: YabP/YqfC family sporulation protein [Oscillospiraceae bacterium]|nr:YabP/YqfC family sporulation protein [Oscillospiraceae bacterium]
MPYDPHSSAPAHHRLELDGRSRLVVSGVEEVERFDENEIVMSTTEGTLIVVGEQLHIDKLTLDGGELHVDGRIESMSYVNESPRGGLLSRIFR